MAGPNSLQSPVEIEKCHILTFIVTFLPSQHY